MNFTCESCQRRFAISDDKVREKAVRVRCKGCGNMITVGPLPEQPGNSEERTRMVAVDDLERLRAKAAEAPKNPWENEPTRAAPPSEAGWFAMIRGKQEGPFDLGALSEKIAGGDISGRTYLWKKGLPDWKRAEDILDLAGLLPTSSSSPSPQPAERPAPRSQGRRADPDAPTPAEGVARPSGPLPKRTATQELDASSLFSDLELSKVVRMPQPDLSDIARHPERAGLGGEAGALADEPGAGPEGDGGSTPAEGQTGPLRVASPRRRPRSAGARLAAIAALLLLGALGTAAVLGIPSVKRTLADGSGAVASKAGGGEARPAKPQAPAAAAPKAADPKEEAKPSEEKESDDPRVVRGGRHLRPSELERAAATSRPWFRACLAQERKRNPNLSVGRVVVRWTLTPSGAVKAVSFDRKDVEDAPIGECMKEKARLLRAGQPGEETVLEIPVNLDAPM